MIALTSISKRFGALTALRDVSLALRPGRITALVGPNGSGKTTLIKIVLGLTRPDGGTLEVGGAAVDAAGAYRRAVGYMPQAARFPENLRVRDVLELVGALRPGVERDEELLVSFGLGPEMDRNVGTLSGGTRQRMNAALAFYFRPALLILDEPTAGLDPIANGILKDKIRRVRADGRTVLVSSHIMSELEGLADDVAFLCDGSLRFAGPVADLLALTGEGRLEGAVAALMMAGRAAPAATSGAANGQPAGESSPA